MNKLEYLKEIAKPKLSPKEIQKVYNKFKNKKILICMPSYSCEIDTRVAESLMRLHKQNFGCFFPTQLPVQHARNRCVDVALKHKFDYLFFVDDDMMLYAMDGLLRLMKLNKDVASGLAYRRTTPHNPCIFMKDNKGEMRALGNWKRGKLLEVEAMGMFFCLIKTSIFSKIKPHRKSKKNADLPSDEYFWMDNKTEDLNFCSLLRDNGVKIYVDTSLEIPHYDKGSGKIVCGLDWQAYVEKTGLSKKLKPIGGKDVKTNK